jgi:biopolymer transport protein ExbD
MKPKDRKQRLISEINITPFTDVILVLLIIFMITTPLILQSSIKVNLPKAASAKPAQNANQAYISITNENLIYLDDRQVTKKELRERIDSMHRDYPELAVILVSDRLVRFRDIVAVLDILNELGVRNLNIAATTEQ